MLTNKNKFLITSRVFFALLGFSALVTEIATLIDRNKFVPTNFFSYFTVQSNLLAVIVLLLSAVAAASQKHSDRMALLRGSSTLNMIVVGIVFSLLLAGLNAQLTAVPWDNTVLHYIMPIVVTLDWLIDLPRARIGFRRALVWMVFPLVYVTYSLIRGHFVGWYPYPFLNAVELGYANVATTSIGIAIGTVGLIWVLVKFTGIHESKTAQNRNERLS